MDESEQHASRATPSTVELENAWSVCADLFTTAISQPSTPTESRVASELLFCLLGGFGVSFELALSAASVVSSLEPFAPIWRPEALVDRVEVELRVPQFHPLTSRGSLRRYRYPRRKAELIGRARTWALAQGPLCDRIVDLQNDFDRRAFLSECPGVGPKTASWVLRNLGMGHRLAILDVHVMRALKDAGRVADQSLPRDYLAIERAFVAWCDELGAIPAAFDLFLWEWQRGTLRARAV